LVVIFGWGAGQAQDLGEVAPATCPNCHNQVFLHHIRSDKHVSLYFIPLVPYGSNEYLACPICRHGLQIHPDQQTAIARMHAVTTAFRTRAITLEAYQPSVERFWQELGVDPSGERVQYPPRTSPPPGSGAAGGTVGAPSSGEPATASLPDRLEALANLHGKGILTDAEFSAAKRRLLER
jgi:uncharacterized protein YbaR (Trm112 family)